MSNYPCTPDLYQPWAYPDYAYHDASSDDAQDPAYLSPTSAYHGPSPVDAQHLGAYNPYFADSVYGGDPYAEHSARNVSSFDSTPAGAPASVYSSTSNSPRLRPDLSRGFSDYRHGYALSQHDAHAAPYNFIDYKLPEQAPVPRVGIPMVHEPYSDHAHSHSSILGDNSRYTPLSSQASPAAEPADRSDFREYGDWERVQCPFPECRKAVKDIKAHVLTHQTERPEKCPIVSCEFHTRGFARRYDKNRHTLTHYRGAMVCPWCPGDKCFNRADVFKRHLTALHAVDPVVISTRNRKSSSSTATSTPPYFVLQQAGRCSTCGMTMSSPTAFYEHLDDCVLQIVQRSERGGLIDAGLRAEAERHSGSSRRTLSRAASHGSRIVTKTEPDVETSSQYLDAPSDGGSSADITPTRENPAGAPNASSGGNRRHSSKRGRRASNPMAKRRS